MEPRTDVTETRALDKVIRIDEAQVQARIAANQIGLFPARDKRIDEIMKTNRIIGLAVASVMAFAVAMACYAAVLDGTHGKVKVVPEKWTADRGEKEFDDTLSFANGIFSSVFSLARGFKPAPYNGETEENEAEFEIEQTSVTNGLINWLGEIRGKKLTGRLMWKTKDGRTLTYNFEGTKD